MLDLNFDKHFRIRVLIFIVVFKMSVKNV